MSKQNKLFIISGPSGVGKTSIAQGLVKKLPWLKTGITYTSRPERSRQKEDKRIYFISEVEFKKKIEQVDFLEWAVVHGFYYGTDRKRVEEVLKNDHLLLNIDVQGALAIKEKMPGSILIFIKSESLEILGRRIKKRGQMDKKYFQERLINAQKELAQTEKYDYVVMNREGELEQAIEEVAEIIKNNT